MERKDLLLLLTAIVAGGLFLHERGELMGGIPYDPVAGTALIYAGYGLILVGGALWLFVATRPIWRRQIPFKYKRLSYGAEYAGNRAPLKHRTTLKVDLCGHPLPESLFVECDAPIQHAVWESKSERGASYEGWVELIPWSRKTTYMRLRHYSPPSADRRLVVLAVSVMAHEPIEILYMRPRRLPCRLSTQPEDPPLPKSVS